MRTNFRLILSTLLLWLGACAAPVEQDAPPRLELTE